MINFVHFLYVPFTGLGLRGGYRGDKWLRDRIRVFEQFVIPSLVNQTSSNFILWVSWRPEDKQNPIVKEFYYKLTRISGIKTPVFTFDGICFWDDKYPEDKLLERLKATLPKLKPMVEKADEVWMTIQPSDDVYLGDSMERVRVKLTSDEAKRQGWNCVGFRNGYVMNYANKQVAFYNPKTIPPFFTIKFPKDVFINPRKHYEYTGPYKSHEFVVNHMKFAPIKGPRGFIVGTHGQNISTTWDNPFQGGLLSQDRAERVMIKAGIWFSDPVVVRHGWRLILRKVFNKIPLNGIIREWYHKLPVVLQRL